MLTTPSSRSRFAIRHCSNRLARRGEIQKLAGGKLALKTTYAGGIQIDWKMIDQLTTEAPVEVEAHCHEGARSYEEHAEHVGYKQDLKADRKSCLMCHNLVHEAGKLDRYDMWLGEATQ